MAAVEPLTTPTDAPTPIEEARAERERKQRVRHAVRTGERIATADQSSHEHYAQVPFAVTLATMTAQRLTQNERQMIDALILHTYGMRSPYAICDFAERELPSTADWCAWLDWQTEQLCHVRSSLITKGVIAICDGDSRKLALAPWEEWDTSLFARRAAKPGAGRKPARAHTVAADTATSTDSEAQPANYLISASDSATTNQVISRDLLPNQSALITQLAAGADQNGRGARREAARAGSPSTISEEKKNTRSSSSSSGVLDLPDELLNVVATLRAIPGWKSDDRLDLKLIMQVVPDYPHGMSAKCLLERAQDYELWIGEDDSRKPTHTNFKSFLQSPISRKKIAEYERAEAQARQAQKTVATLRASGNGAAVLSPAEETERARARLAAARKGNSAPAGA